MKSHASLKPIAYSQEPLAIRLWLSAICYLLLAFFMTGCIRLTGSAGYTKVKEDEVVAKTTGFDLDGSRLVDQRGVS